MRFLPVVVYIFCFYLEVVHCVIKQEFNYFTVDKCLHVFLFFFFFFATVNKASGTLSYKYLCRKAFISLVQMPRTEIVGSQSKSILNIKRNFQTVFQFSFFNHFTLPLIMCKSVSCYPIPSNFGTDILFNFSHSSYFKWHIFIVLISDVLKINIRSLVLIEPFMYHILPCVYSSPLYVFKLCFVYS